jgi:hypothetical protein
VKSRANAIAIRLVWNSRASAAGRIPTRSVRILINLFGE